MSNEIATQASPSTLIEMAINKQASIETLERLFILQKDWEANEARKEFVKAMVDFKSEPMVIEKRKLVSFTNKAGTTTSYLHAELSDVVAVMIPAMAKHGLSHRWTVGQKEADITVACIVTHAQGHSESVSMTARPDDSGGKNAIQAIASAVSYLQRYTLLAAGGMATGGDDNDGRGAETSAEESGEALALYMEGLVVAKKGTDELVGWYRNKLTESQRAVANSFILELKATAKAVAAEPVDVAFAEEVKQ
jgi:hypothetical protein